MGVDPFGEFGRGGVVLDDALDLAGGEFGFALGLEQVTVVGDGVEIGFEGEREGVGEEDYTVFVAFALTDEDFGGGEVDVGDFDVG